MKRLLLLFLLIINCGLAGRSLAQTERVNYSTLSVANGLSQISVLDILQDSKGFIWMATRNGLNRYDGSSFLCYGQTGDSRALSDNNITTLAEDRDGNLWVGTNQGLNKLDLSTGQNTIYSDKPEYEAFDNTVRALRCDGQGRMLIGTRKGLFVCTGPDRFEPVTLGGELDGKSIEEISLAPDGKLLIGTTAHGLYVCRPDYTLIRHLSTHDGSLPTNSVSVIYTDSRGATWMGNPSDGVIRIDLETGVCQVFDAQNSALPSSSIRCFADDGTTLYIGTSEGLCTMPLDDRGRISYEQNNLSNFSVYSILIDKSGTRWVGTYSGGVNYYNPVADRLDFHQPMAPHQDYANIFGSMDCDGAKLYIATEGNGLLEYDSTTGEAIFHPIADTRHQHSRNIIKSVRRDGRLLTCGTALGEIYTFDLDSKQFRKYAELPKSSIYATLRTGDGSMWAATSKDNMGLVQTRDGVVVRSRFTPDSLHVTSARVLAQESPTSLLVGTRRSGMQRYDFAADRLTPVAPNELGTKYITAILPYGKSQFYVGTYGHGLYLYDAQKGEVRYIDILQEKGASEICQLVEDARGFVWICTSAGITRYQPETNEEVAYNRFSQISIQEFTPHSGVAVPGGVVAFAGSNGFITFHPDQMQLNTYNPPLVFTGLKINNQPILPDPDGSILTRGLDDTQHIRLSYNQNNIEISYVALNFLFPEQNRYAYRLKGVDDDWQTAGNRQSAHYANLAPGSYTFEVRGANNDGVWNSDVRSLQITILPPLWKRWWAYTIYVLLFLGFCGLIMYYIINKKSLEQSLIYEKQRQQQAEEFHQAKIRMFTNFSHELRTPLTLIVSPLQELLKCAEFNASTRNKLSLIHNNSQRLLLLVNQLMDLHKNEAGKLQLQVAKDDLGAFLQEIHCAFNQIAASKNISLTYECRPQSLPAWFDKSTIEKVAFNLLSNAFKFTPEGGAIVMDVSLTDAADSLLAAHPLPNLSPSTPVIHLRVSDTGKGIPADEIENIFSPFYQVDDRQQKSIVGTGIGLSLTLSIVRLHHGVIWAENNSGGPGATFHVLIPNDIALYSDDEIDHEAPDRVVLDVLPPTAPPETSEEKRHTLLLVEDNEEVRHYVRDCLSPYYNVVEADNGATAFDIAIDRYPDIIVSDIMMPEKDGLELCTDIKNDLRTGHIPVILMTARSMVMHIKEGFAVGADDYVVKPFNMDVLLYRIKNLLDSRERLRNLYGKKFAPEALGIEIVSGEDKFTEKFFGIIEKNIKNSELNINFICQEIGMSRANLYRKLKAITDLSPMELIRNKRLEVGAKLLLRSNMPIAEVSACIGFNSHAYFTSCFKAVYGMSPSEFVEANKGKG